MQTIFWPSSSPFPATRSGALARLAEFEKTASGYGRDRNLVVPGHPHVSRLSPAIRHRLITEEEVAKYVLHRDAFSTVEKFLQEVYWRRYWKSWLGLHPQVWTEYLDDLAGLSPCDTALKVMSGNGEIAVMNAFARELIETGYLHNHARMWFAAYWIHHEKLPWQLGADFFYRHLLDADPASNTLSWRWVAGLQTPGKTYLARRSNIEKYLHPDLLHGHTEGLELLDQGRCVHPEIISRPSVKAKAFENPPINPDLKTGFWMHDEDLSAEPCGDCILLTEETQSSPAKKRWMDEALEDTRSRLSHFNIERGTTSDMAEWAVRHQLKQIVARRPEIGSIHDQLPGIQSELKQLGVELVLQMRAEDLAFQSYGTAGFFGFWKTIEPRLRAKEESP